MPPFNFPYQVLRVPGSEALKTVSELRSNGIGIPIILGNQETFERVVECMELNEGSTPDELIELPATLTSTVGSQSAKRRTLITTLWSRPNGRTPTNHPSCRSALTVTFWIGSRMPK